MATLNPKPLLTPERRSDDAETFEALVISAVHYADEESGGRPLHLVIGFADEHARLVVPHPTPEAAVAAVAA